MKQYDEYLSLRKYDAYIFTNEEKGTYKEIDAYYWKNNNDLWNYYYDGKAYPLYAPSDAKVTETNNTYTDRATIKWQAVSGASGYNVYINNKKVNVTTINADINGDGKVNIKDAMKIFYYASGRSTEC